MRQVAKARWGCTGAAALLLGVLAVQPATAFGGAGGHGGGGRVGGGLGGGFGGGHGGVGNGGRRIHPGSHAGGFNGREGRRGGFGFGQNGDGLSDYAPYGRPVDGCDPSTPARVRYYCVE